MQNGEVKAAQTPTSDSLQIVNETKVAEQPAEAKSEQVAGLTCDDQQVAAESSPLVSEDCDKALTETMPPEDASNGPTVTLEV